MKRKTARLQEKKAEEGKRGFAACSDMEEKQRRLQVSSPQFSPRLLQGLSEDSATRWKSRWHILSILLTALVGSQKAAKNKPKPGKSTSRFTAKPSCVFSATGGQAHPEDGKVTGYLMKSPASEVGQGQNERRARWRPQIAAAMVDSLIDFD